MSKLFHVIILAGLTCIFINYAEAQVPEFWGTAADGGIDNNGLIYKLDDNGQNFQVVYDFQTVAGQDYYYTKLCEASNRKLYGTTRFGGRYNNGIIFEYDPAFNTYETVFHFDSLTGFLPYSGLVQSADGLLYGATSFGGNNEGGTIYSFDINTNLFSVEYHLTDSTGNNSFGALLLADNGKLYGTTRYGGDFNDGVIFEFDPATNIYLAKFHFEELSSGERPSTGFIQADNGLLYSTTYSGGINDEGVLFSYDPSTGSFSKLFDFQESTDGASSYAPLFQASNGKLYGTTIYGGSSDYGTIYNFDITTHTFSVSHHFDGINGGGARGGLAANNDGKLFGTSNTGGLYGNGTIFEFDPATEILSNRFDFEENITGKNTYGTFTLASNGKFYCGNNTGASNNEGVLYEFNPDNDQYKIVNRFNLALLGNDPLAGLVEAENSLLYGVTQEGGSNDCGAIFEINPNFRTVIKRAEFDGTILGRNPEWALIQADNGKLYGLTALGGLNNKGTLYEFDPEVGSLLKLYDFESILSGQWPEGALLQASNGKLYGNTRGGGVFDEGTLFEFDLTTLTLEIKHHYKNSTGRKTNGSLIEAANGKLYGTTQWGGPTLDGVLFEYDISTEIYSVFHDFNASPTGSVPLCGLLEGSDGLLYGTTTMGGPTGNGVLFRISTAGVYEMLQEFNSSYGEFPIGKLMEASNGNLYGLTNQGGTYDGGVLFEYNIEDDILSLIRDFEASTGSVPNSGLIEVDVCASTLGMLSVTACNSYTTPSGQILTSSDIYIDTVLSHDDCDSLIAIELIINSADASVTQFPNSIYANATGATYQWIYCNDNTIIEGATAQSYTPSSSGSYAVEVSQNDCSTLSECIFFELASGLASAFEDQIKLYPNPTSSNVFLEFESVQNTGITVRTIEGKEVYNIQSASQARIEIPSSTWPAGIYLVYVEGRASNAPIKLIKE